MALDLSSPNPSTTKVKEVADKITVNGYKVVRNLEQGVLKSYLQIDIAYGTESNIMDVDFPDTPLFNRFRVDLNYIDCSLEELKNRLYAASQLEVPLVTLQQLQDTLTQLKAADDANTTAILALITLLDSANIKKIPTEEISRLV